MNLLTTQNAKTSKGEKIGYLTGILYLLPADSSGIVNVCANATAGCKASCLNTAGRGAFDSVQAGRMRKTRWLVSDRQSFIEQLRKDILSLVRIAKRKKLIPCVRLNGTSDLPWLGLQLSAEFPNVQFYDYTKHPRPWERVRPNYHLTFSYSETNLADTLDALDHGINVAMVFDTKRSMPLPQTWNGYKIINGDETDLRFTDSERGAIVGLHAKGRARKDCTGFVVRHSGDHLVQIAL